MMKGKGTEGKGRGGKGMEGEGMDGEGKGREGRYFGFGLKRGALGVASVPHR